ncbi:unnamed protein product [Agarophyton chilense]|eukprot:gb/GEZJ01000297.1/.p1 GENE.gb/GEZJ01000297.1/~~gb/GEZJ01000297.1/.p1  ORF type:complete len:536 (-),score=79.09 gb/GEZJ01000297.1/:2753-4360(-)
MSSSFPTSWEPYGSSQQNANLAWRRNAALPSQQAPPLTTRWQSTQDATQPSPLPSLDPSQRLAPDLNAFQANDREQKSVARFESIREEIQHVTAQLRQLNANIETLRGSQAQPFPALIGEVGRLSQLISELLQRPGVHGSQSNIQFAMASEKRIMDTVLAMTDAVAGVQTSCASFIPRLDSGLASVERLVHTTTSTVATDVPKWFEMAFRQMTAHHVAPMLMESEKRLSRQFETTFADMVTGIEKHVSMAVSNGVAQVLNRISLEQKLGVPPSANLIAANEIGDTQPRSKTESIPDKNSFVKQTPKETPVAGPVNISTTTLPGHVPLTSEPLPSQRAKSGEQVQPVASETDVPKATSPFQTALNSKTKAAFNRDAQANDTIAAETKLKPSPPTQNRVAHLDSKKIPEQAPVRKEEDSTVDEIDIFEESEIQKKAKSSKTKGKEATQRQNGKQGARPARQQKQQHTEPSAHSDTESSESKEPSDEEGEEESEWECDESDAGSQSSGGSQGAQGHDRSSSKRLKRSFVRRSKRRRRA